MYKTVNRYIKSVIFNDKYEFDMKARFSIYHRENVKDSKKQPNNDITYIKRCRKKLIPKIHEQIVWYLKTSVMLVFKAETWSNITPVNGQIHSTKLKGLFSLFF